MTQQSQQHGGIMSRTDWKGLCQELLADYEQHLYRSELIARARAALAQPEPEVGPSDDELLSLDQLREAWNAQADAANSWDELGIDEIIWWAQHQALARWGRPAPAPAGEVAELLMALELLVNAADEYGPAGGADGKALCQAVERARSTLTHFFQPAQRTILVPAPAPIGQEVAELAAWLNDHATSCEELGRSDWAKRCRASAYLLQRQAAPAPTGEEEPCLHWTENRPPGTDNCPYDHCIAETPFGRFLITWKSWKKYDSPAVDETPWGDWWQAFGSVDKAKDACKREYVKRLLACRADNSADLLERQADPVPVAIADRLPTPSECDQGRCWWGRQVNSIRWSWTFSIDPQGDTHWLPATVEHLPANIVPLLPEDAQVIEPAKHTILVPAQVPVAVSERLPQPEDCDADGYCWRWNTIGRLWARQPLARRWYEFESHWLPGWFLPLPSVEVEHG